MIKKCILIWRCDKIAPNDVFPNKDFQICVWGNVIRYFSIAPITLGALASVRKDGKMQVDGVTWLNTNTSPGSYKVFGRVGTELAWIKQETDAENFDCGRSS